MTESQAVLFLLRQGPQTCGDFIGFTWTDKGKFHGLAAEYRARISELRPKLKLQGQNIYYDRGTKLYTLGPWPPVGELRVEANGQESFV